MFYPFSLCCPNWPWASGLKPSSCAHLLGSWYTRAMTWRLMTPIVILLYLPFRYLLTTIPCIPLDTLNAWLWIDAQLLLLASEQEPEDFCLQDPHCWIRDSEPMWNKHKWGERQRETGPFSPNQQWNSLKYRQLQGHLPSTSLWSGILSPPSPPSHGRELAQSTLLSTS